MLVTALLLALFQLSDQLMYITNDGYNEVIPSLFYVHCWNFQSILSELRDDEWHEIAILPAY